MAKHNKKRNVGLIHEQLVKYVAGALIKKDNQSAESAIQMIVKHFKPKSELYKEFRLFNAMINMPVGSKSLAERVLNESREAAKTHDAQKLRKEKSLLIKDINTRLSEAQSLYDIKIDNYRLYATVQSVLNEWRGRGKLDLTAKASYEEKVVEWLSREDKLTSLSSDKADPLVQKMMFEKFEKKYKDYFSEDQKNLLEISTLGSEGKFAESVRELKERAKRSLGKYRLTCDNSLIKENIDEVGKKIQNLSEKRSSEAVSRALHLIHLLEEIDSNE
jgi:hypothetical protein|tara:strand:+ start:1195 stop:2019 length:825 start_codon:yes stop_codon:yes gene_type:complete